MKRVLAVALFVIILLAMLNACGTNIQIIDTTWRYSYGYVYLGGEKIAEGKVDSWLDFENSDMIQVKIDGKVYLTHSANVVLVG
ncbi:MAG: hypothetical protein E7576_07030 [Ruminococcaceae bacterium]|nr:hypothetical protein [Oscillospiraceae bacterium]